jgi:glycosyltransferase involved in cell wall biosynthesis
MGDIGFYERREQMINVLHLINYPGQGGSERYILSLAEKLHNRECRFYLGYSMEGPMLEQARELGIMTLNIPMSSPFDFRAAKMLKDVCEEFSVDVVHTHFLRENYVSIFSKIMGNKSSVINTSHLLTKKSLFLKLSNRVMTLKNDGIIAVSNAVRKQMIKEGINPKGIELIYNGVDVDYWKGRRDYRVRREFNIGRNDFLIVSIARFAEEKGHIFLLEAIKMFKKSFIPDGEKDSGKVRFILVGDGELLDECKKFAEMLGVSDDIIFTGFRNDIKSILHGSDLFISHSESEALGISILEALCSQLPVIAAKSGGPVEIINEGSNCGILVEYGDVDALTEAIIKFVTNKKFYKECKDNTLVTVEEKFNLDKTAQETYNLYKRCLGTRSGGHAQGLDGREIK